MRVGLLGGSFDPIHKGHLKLAKAALSQLKLSRVYFVLNPKSPFKSSRLLAPVSNRLRLLKLALHKTKHFCLGTWECKSEKPSYTVTTLSNFRKRHPNHSIFFIMGSDSWKSFPRWKNPERILKLATLVVGFRPPTNSIRVPEKWKSCVHILRGTFPNISATQIRKLAQDNSPALKKILPPCVYQEVLDRGYYS